MNQKYVVVTGASSGIGRGTAKKFASLGRNVILVARRGATLEELKAEITNLYPTVKVVIFVQDLGAVTELTDFYQQVNQYPIDLWINNAGFGRHKTLAEMSETEIVSMIQLNVIGLTILSQRFTADHQDDPDAQLINISSTAGYHIYPGVAVYGGTKFFVSSMTESLAQELKNDGHKMQAKVMAPAATETEFATVADGKNQEVDYATRYQGHYNTSEELADFIVELAASRYTVGIVNEKNQLELSHGIF